MPPILEGFVARIGELRSPGTARAYAKVARGFLKHLGRKKPGATDVESFIASSSAGRRFAIATRNHRLAALRALAKHAVGNGAWRSDPTEGIEFQREPPRDPAVLSSHEVHRLFGAVEASSPFDQVSRDRAILALLFTVGLRVHELVGIDVHQLDVQSATLVAVRGKGNTLHDLPLAKATLDLLHEWLRERVDHASEAETALFVSRRGGRLSSRSVQRMFARLRLATATAKRVTPHTARHTAATLAILNGADISSIGELLRHTDINVTRQYVRLIDTRKRGVTELLSRVLAKSLRATEAVNAGDPATVVRKRCLLPIDAIATELVSFDHPSELDENPVDGKDDFPVDA